MKRTSDNSAYQTTLGRMRRDVCVLSQLGGFLVVNSRNLIMLCHVSSLRLVVKFIFDDFYLTLAIICAS